LSMLQLPRFVSNQKVSTCLKGFIDTEPLVRSDGRWRSWGSIRQQMIVRIRGNTGHRTSASAWTRTVADR
jgi:hypothetical protein